jgi:Ser/Thr protein kinase RdoA (MazF antagonist)
MEAMVVPARVLEAYGLTGAGLSRLPGSGACWVTSAEGPRLVLKRRRAPGPLGGVAWETGLREAAGRAGWPVAEPMAAADGAAGVLVEGEVWTCERWRPGAARAGETVATWRILGRLLGRLHGDLAAADPLEQRPGLGKVWELDVLTEGAGVGSFNRLVAAMGRDYPDLATAIRRERYANLRELARLGYPELPEQPIHGDFAPKNLLWSDGELTGVLDWEFARRDAAMCDLAPLLMPFGPLEMEFARALFEGYSAVRPISNQEFGLLPALVRASLLWWVTVLLIRWRRDGAEPSGIARTMTVRLPAFERFALELGELRGSVRG